MPPAGRFLGKYTNLLRKIRCGLATQAFRAPQKLSIFLGPLIVKNMTRTACLQAAVCNKLVSDLVHLHVAYGGVGFSPLKRLENPSLSLSY